MKRVLLVNTNTVTVPAPVPPLGLCMLAQVLSGDREVLVFDGTMRDPSGLPDVAAGFAPDHVGIGIRNVDDLTMQTGVSWVEGIVERFVEPLRAVTGAHLVLGGGGFSIFPQEWLDACDVRYGVLGEAEVTFPALLDALESGRDPALVPGVVTRGAPLPDPAPPLDPRSIPRAHLHRWLDFPAYMRAGASYSLQTKRGCRHRCSYCTYPHIEGRSFRPREPRDIVDEMEEVRGVLDDPVFEFVDSTFNDPPGHAEAICREILSRGLRLRLRTMGVNPAGATPALLALMREAGFVQIDCTPDSASPAVIREGGKGFTREDLETAARAIREAAMPTMWFFLFGGPGETERTFHESVEFIDEHVEGMDMVYMASGIRIYPHTPLHQRAVREGVVAGERSLFDPVFYVSPDLDASRLDDLVIEASRSRPNCIPAWETAPPEDMRRKAREIRRRRGLDEPMFRTLLRLRYWMAGERP